MANTKELTPVPSRSQVQHEIIPHCDYGGYYPDTKTFKPFGGYDFTYEVLDAITAAVEDGVVYRETWFKQFFASKAVFSKFVDELEEMDDYGRIYDRWYFALFNLVDAVNEEGFVTSREIAERLQRQAAETGQI